MPRFEAVRPQQVNAVMFLDDLGDGVSNLFWQNEMVEAPSGLELEYERAAPRLGRWTDAPRALLLESIRQLGCEHTMLLRLLLSDDGFDSAPEADLVAGGSGPDQRDEKIRACHRLSLPYLDVSVGID